MLQIITGGAGCGKTYYTRDRLCDLARSGGEPVLLVPEQFSFESERAMLTLLGAQDAARVRVLSFTRLAEEVSREAGGAAGRRLDDCGRVAAMGLVLSELNGVLTYYKGKRSSYFIEHLLDAVKEFRLCAVRPEQLSSAAGRTTGILSRKLAELSQIFAAYEAVTARTALDPLEDLDRLYEQLADHRYFAGRTVYIDSFRGFTGQELRILSRIMEQAELCAVTVCAEPPRSAADEQSGLFATAHRTIKRLERIAADCGCQRLAPVRLDKRHRYRSDALNVLEASVFRCGGERLLLEEPTDDVTIYEASDSSDEMEFCARECRRLIREEGYRCRDIVVIARDEQTYTAIAADALALQEVPCFADLRTDAAGSALMRFVLAALNAARGGLRTADMLRFLKAGMIDGLSPIVSDKAGKPDGLASAVAELDNYCYVWDIKGDEWYSPFERSPDGFDGSASNAEATAKLLARINAVRERALSLIEPLRKALASERGAVMAKAVFELVESAGTAACMGRLADTLPPTGVDELQQLWKLLCSILEQLHAILGDSRCSAGDFVDYVTLMIKRGDIGRIPQGLDEVTVGGAERVRTTAPRAVFVVGAAEGAFPAIPGSAGVFTDEERRRLREELEVPVAESFEERLLEERLLAYGAMTAASERLYLSWPSGGSDGSRTEYSECISETLACLPKARRRSHADPIDPERLGSAAAMFEAFARSLGRDDRLAASIREALCRREEWRARVAAVERAAKGDAAGALGSRGSRALFGDSISLSASRAEAYHTCRYLYLCRHGLGLKPRRKAELDTMKYGTVTHYVLEELLRECGGDLDRLTDRELMTERIVALLERYITDELGGREGKSQAFLYRLEIMKRSLLPLALNLGEEFKTATFRPQAFEQALEGEGTELVGKSGMTGRLSGIIDRVDVSDVGGVRRLRVIDYKTGSKTFKLSHLLDGLDMQMVIYLSSLCRDGAEPAGLLYCPAYTSFFEGEQGMAESRIADKQAAELHRKGLIIDGEDLANSRAMEPDMKGRYIPVKTRNDGELNGSCVESLISREQFGVVSRYIRRVLERMLDGVGSGELAPDPMTKGSYDTCDSCDFRPICRYTGARRELTTLKNAETLDRMKKELGEEDEEQ